MPRKGVIKLGAPADVIVYDYENLKVLPPKIAFDLPGGEWRRVQRASGYKYIFINGQITIKDDKEVNQYPGQLLRKK